MCTLLICVLAVEWFSISILKKKLIQILVIDVNQTYLCVGTTCIHVAVFEITCILPRTFAVI